MNKVILIKEVKYGTNAGQGMTASGNWDAFVLAS